MSMMEARNRQIATTIANGLDVLSCDLIMPYLLDGIWTYKQAKEAVLKEFRSPEKLATSKMKFFNIEFKPSKTLVEFADCLYHEAQILVESGSMTDFDSKIAMEHTIKPYKEFHIAMIPVFNDRNMETKEISGLPKKMCYVY